MAGQSEPVQDSEEHRKLAAEVCKAIPEFGRPKNEQSPPGAGGQNSASPKAKAKAVAKRKPRHSKTRAQAAGQGTLGFHQP